MAVLKPMLQVFRACGEAGLATASLEAAAAAAPDSEEINRQLAFAYLGAEEYKKMQQVRRRRRRRRRRRVPAHAARSHPPLPPLLCRRRACAC